MGKIALERAEIAAEAVIKQLSPYCKKIEVAGSVRRQKSWVKDVDFVLIVSDLWGLHSEVKKLGQVRAAGAKLMRVMAGATQIDLYIATPETWATLLLIRTGSADNNIRLATLAKKRGWHLAASGDGLFDENGERVAGDSERSIYDALDIQWQEPWERG